MVSLPFITTFYCYYNTLTGASYIIQSATTDDFYRIKAPEGVYKVLFTFSLGFYSLLYPC